MERERETFLILSEPFCNKQTTSIDRFAHTLCKFMYTFVLRSANLFLFRFISFRFIHIFLCPVFFSFSLSYFFYYLRFTRIWSQEPLMREATLIGYSFIFLRMKYLATHVHYKHLKLIRLWILRFCLMSLLCVLLPCDYSNVWMNVEWCVVFDARKSPQIFSFA